MLRRTMLQPAQNPPYFSDNPAQIMGFGVITPKLHLHLLRILQ
jgi:hypothetical protein